jgi:hypothetical protein
VSGLTEVQGQVDGRNNIQCSKYITFPDEVSDKFSKCSFVLNVRVFPSNIISVKDVMKKCCLNYYYYIKFHLLGVKLYPGQF